MIATVRDDGVTERPIGFLYAWICMDENGSEGIVGIRIPGPDNLPWLPLVSSKLEVMERFVEEVEAIAATTKYGIRLVEFTQGRELLRINGNQSGEGGR